MANESIATQQKPLIVQRAKALSPSAAAHYTGDDQPYVTSNLNTLARSGAQYTPTSLISLAPQSQQPRYTVQQAQAPQYTVQSHGPGYAVASDLNAAFDAAYRTRPAQGQSQGQNNYMVQTQLPQQFGPTLHDIGIGMGGQLSNLLVNGYTQAPSRMVSDLNSAWTDAAGQMERAAAREREAKIYADQLAENRRQFDAKLGFDRDRLAAQDSRFNGLLGALGGAAGGSGSGSLGGFYDSPSGQGAALPGYSLPPGDQAQGGQQGGLAPPVQQMISQMAQGTGGQSFGTPFGTPQSQAQAAGQMSHAASTTGSRNAVDFTRQLTPQAANLNLQGQVARANEGLGLAGILQNRQAAQSQQRLSNLRSISSLMGYV